MEITKMPKIECPYVRKEVGKAFIVTPEVAEGFEWVFEDKEVIAVEKLHGTNVSIAIQYGVITDIWGREERIPFFNKGKGYVIDGLQHSYRKGYMEFMRDGQYFGELIGPKVNKNPYKLKDHIWIPFETYARKYLRFKSWGKYPKDFDSISKWFKEDLMPLYALRTGIKEDGFVEGVVFIHPDGRMAKLRRDMFDWYRGGRH